MNEHIPVLLDAVIDGLAIKPQGCYLDGTFGRGGHSQRILDQLDEQGRLLAIDKDPQAIATAQQHLGHDKRFAIVHHSFAALTRICQQNGVFGNLDGILLDLGVSSPQLDQAERGFSFRHDGPLDMRMDTSQGQPLSDWLASADEKMIADVLWRYGEEKQSRQIAREIIRQRQQQPITRTLQLAQLIHTVMPHKATLGKHPATRSFQALRIMINQELDDLSHVLTQAFAALAPGGRLAIISFHSLEDRLVKRFMRTLCEPTMPRHLPLTTDQIQAKARWCVKMYKANQQEIQDNSRARSAVLRIVEKI